MIGDRRLARLPEPLLVAALIVVTVATSVAISKLVIGPGQPWSGSPTRPEWVHAPAVVPAHGLARVDAECPAGTVVTGGGSYADVATASLFVLDNLPVRSAGKDVWRVRFSNRSAKRINVGSVAVCAAGSR